MKNAQASLENWLQLKQVMQPHVSEWLKGEFNELRKRRSALWALMCWILLSEWKRRCCQTSVCLLVAEDERRKSEWLSERVQKNTAVCYSSSSPALQSGLWWYACLWHISLTLGRPRAQVWRLWMCVYLCVCGAYGVRANVAYHDILINLQRPALCPFTAADYVNESGDMGSAAFSVLWPPLKELTVEMD